MLEDYKTNFDFFNKVVNEQIAKVQESTIDDYVLEKISSKINADDVFNSKLKASILIVMDSTILKAVDDLKVKTESMKSLSMESILKSNPLGKHFENFIVELFEIAQSSESLKYTLKFIIDTVLKFDKYNNQISWIFLCYLISSENQTFYPDDYVDHADFISQFCSDYLLLKKYTGFIQKDALRDVYAYMKINDSKKSIFTYRTIDTYTNRAFNNSYAVVSNGWILLTHYTEVLTEDGSVLANNTFSDFHKNIIFKNIDNCLREYKISDLDYLDYLMRVLAQFLKQNGKNKLIDKKLRTIVVYLLESGFGLRNKDNIIRSLSKQFATGVSRLSLLKKSIEDYYDGRSSYNDSRGSKNIAQKKDEMDDQSYLNIGFAWVSLIFIHEGIFDLKSLLDEFSKYNNSNEVLMERLSFYHNKNTEDYISKLLQEEASSTENALSAASLLTASRDDEFTNNESQQTSTEVKIAPTVEKKAKSETFSEEKSNNGFAKIPVKMFPQVLLMTAFLEVKCFKEASYILSSFKYLFSGISDLEELFSDMLSSYGKQIIDHEPKSIEDEIKKNSYNWLFIGPGKLNIEYTKLSIDEYFAVGTNIINNGINSKCIKSTFDSFTSILYHYKKLDDKSFYENVSNSLINCIINDLIPRCLLNSKSISKHLFLLLKHYHSEVRYEVYDIFTKKVINENKRLKEINFLQQKQIKRFLKVVNVDNLSDQLEKLAILVNINPFITLNNCLNLAESYDMISNLLIQSMKQFSDFSLDVLQYTILNRLKLDRPFFSEDEGLALPWFAKMCTLITNGFNSYAKFSIHGIFDFLLEKIISLDFSGVYILDSLLTGSSDCLYLTDVQDELAILYSGNEQTKKIALEKTDATKKQKTHKLMKILTKKKQQKTHALAIIESLNAIVFEIFYDSFQSVNKITNNYDTVIRVQRLIIDILAHNNNYDAFVETFDISNILTNPSLQFVSDALKALLLRNASKTIQRELLPLLSNDNSLTEVFWSHSLSDLNMLAISHMPKNLRGTLNPEMFSAAELDQFESFKEIEFSNDQLQLFLENCLFKNSILGVAEAIYSAEFMFKVLPETELTKLLNLIFSNSFISKIVIGISSNESKFFAAFIKRIFMILPSYYTLLEEETLKTFKASVVSLTNSFAVEFSDLVLDVEYINCRNAIQILSESIKYLPPIDVFVKILVDAIEKRLSNENRKELLVPLNAVIGFSRTKLKECERIMSFCDNIELDDKLKDLDEILQLTRQVIQEQLKLEQCNDDLNVAESEKKATIEKINEKKVSIEQEATLTKRFNDGEDLRKDIKRVKLNYEENDDSDISKSVTPEVGAVTTGSRFEGFGDKSTIVKAALPKPVTLSLPTQPKSKFTNKIQEQLEDGDFIKYMNNKLIRDIRPYPEFDEQRSFVLLEDALKADPKFLSYVVPTLKFFRLSRLVDVLLDILNERPEYFMNGLLYSLIHVFTYNGKSEYKRMLIDLWHKVDLNTNLKISLDRLKNNWHRLTNFKTVVYDHRLPYTFVEQIDILVQYLVTKKENKVPDETMISAFLQKQYPEAAFSSYAKEAPSNYRDVTRRESDRNNSRRRDDRDNIRNRDDRDIGRRRDDRDTGRRRDDRDNTRNRDDRDLSRRRDNRQNDDLRSSSNYDRGYSSQNRRDESESRFNRRQSDRKYSYRDSRRY